MKKYRIEYTVLAYFDLRDIHHYIAVGLGESGIAARQLARIKRAIGALDTLPERYGRIDWEPWSSAGVRHMPVDSYIVYYIVNAGEAKVTILRVVYGGRDIKNILSQE